MFGVMVGFMIIIGDLLTPVICQWSHHASDCETSKLIYLNRDFLIFLVIVTCIFPLSFFAKIHQLERSSVLAVGSVLCLLVVVVWRSIEHLVDAGSSYKVPTLFDFSLLGFAQSAPIICFALGTRNFNDISLIPNRMSYSSYSYLQ